MLLKNIIIIPKNFFVKKSVIFKILYILQSQNFESVCSKNGLKGTASVPLLTETDPEAHLIGCLRKLQISFFFFNTVKQGSDSSSRAVVKSYMSKNCHDKTVGINSFQ